MLVRGTSRTLADQSEMGHLCRIADLRGQNPHMLRHSCGFYLTEPGQQRRVIQDYLGHASAESTALYTRVSAKAFEGLWR